jgi:peroxiredoxin
MPYHVVALTMAQVRQGALGFQRQLSAALRETKDLKVYAVSPFDLEERRRFKDRFGGDVVYFFNDAARDLIQQQGSELKFVAEIDEGELPRRRTVVIGIPE